MILVLAKVMTQRPAGMRMTGHLFVRMNRMFILIKDWGIVICWGVILSI